MKSATKATKKPKAKATIERVDPFAFMIKRKTSFLSEVTYGVSETVRIRTTSKWVGPCGKEETAIVIDDREPDGPWRPRVGSKIHWDPNQACIQTIVYSLYLSEMQRAEKGT